MNKDFEQIFKPFYYLTTICGVRKIRLQNHEILPMNYVDVTVSVLANIGQIILYCITFNEFIVNFKTAIIFYIYTVIYLLQVIDHTILNIVNFCQSNINLAMFLTLRKIYKHLSLKKDLKKIKFQLSFSCIFHIFGYSLFVVGKLSMDPLWSWGRGLFIFSSIIFDLELIYSGFIIIFISNKVKTWAKILGNIDEKIINHEAVFRKMDFVFRMLMKAIVFNKKAFQLTVMRCSG